MAYGLKLDMQHVLTMLWGLYRSHIAISTMLVSILILFYIYIITKTYTLGVRKTYDRIQELYYDIVSLRAKSTGWFNDVLFAHSKLLIKASRQLSQLRLNVALISLWSILWTFGLRQMVTGSGFSRKRTHYHGISGWTLLRRKELLECVRIWLSGLVRMDTLKNCM